MRYFCLIPLLFLTANIHVKSPTTSGFNTTATGLAPNISYQSPQYYSVGSAITPLAPTNSGGAVPATSYGGVTTFAGSTTPGLVDGTGTAARFFSPTRLSLDAGGNAFVSDRDNNLIRKITPAGVVSTFASGFNQPNATAVDITGNVYVADAATNSIKKVTSAGVVSVYAGGTMGSNNGIGTSASFYYPFGVAVDLTGTVFVADTRNNLIRKITSGGVVTTLAGSGAAAFSNGTGTAASFSDPGCVTLDAAGNVYVCDGANQVIRKVTPLGVVTTFAGSGVAGSANGATTTASFNRPSGLALDPIGNFYIADINNNQIRKIDAAGNVTTLAGNATAGTANGIGTAASFNRPNDVQYDPSGFLLVTDFGNNLIRKILVTGYTIDKALPPGLTFDTTTGIISGTPTSIFPSTVYTITAYNISGSSTTTVTITILANSPTLTITADNQTRVYGVANPALTVKYSGFIGTDDASKLTIQPSVTTTAGISSPIGIYPITAAGAAIPGYTIAYIQGSLTITALPRTLIFNPIANKSPSDADFDPGATIDTNDPIIYTSSDPSVAVVINGKVHIVGPGTVTITATVPARANYADVIPKTQIVNILANPDDIVEIRPVITPNGDGINDVLMIDGIKKYPDNKITVVNLNGIKVFEGNNYDNVTNVFNGRSNITGVFQPQGTYFYSLQFKVNGETKKKVGYVVLKY